MVTMADNRQAKLKTGGETTQAQSVLVRDDGEVSNFTMIPHLVDDAKISPHAFRLYCHLKRVAGDSGACWQTQDTLAKSCRISKNTVVKAKRELLKAKLIKVDVDIIQNHPAHVVRVLDVWAENNLSYRRKIGTELRPPEGQSLGPQRALKNTHVKNTHIKNTQESIPTGVTPSATHSDALTLEFTSYKKMTEGLRNAGNKVGYLVDAFRSLHVDAPADDLESVGGRLAAIVKQARGDHELVLSKIYAAQLQNIAGSRLSYIQAALSGKAGSKSPCKDTKPEDFEKGWGV